MKDCNAEAKQKGLKGKERKDFMKGCLKKDSAAADAGGKPKNAAQQRMKDCNAEAKSKALEGKERKDFMKSCLKK
ncbi:MAG: phosphate starvation-inducible protein PsiF [Deltaproteobacteria bacterium]|nr:phosphate starvation-inducible protein PsiF [Deltaproteobacteria bacterium]